MLTLNDFIQLAKFIQQREDAWSAVKILDQTDEPIRVRINYDISEALLIEFNRIRGDGFIAGQLNDAERTPRKIVACDEDCGAFVDPETLEEYQSALEHWRYHGFHCGCSHGR